MFYYLVGFLLPLFIQGLNHFDEILKEADGIILSRGTLGIDLPPEKVSFWQSIFSLGIHFLSKKMYLMPQNFMHLHVLY